MQPAAQKVMDDTDLTSTDRRAGSRQDAAIPIRIDTDARPDRVGIIWNMSHQGALVGTPSRFQIADRALLRLCSDGREPRDVEARIVRIEVNDPKSAGIFRYRMAVRFFEPLPMGALEG